MRESTLNYHKQNSERKCKIHKLQTQINKLTSSINAEESFEETKKLEGELLKINEDYLADQSANFKNTVLLNDCKPTAEFLNMEKLKGRYCSLTKLRVQRTDILTNLKVEEEKK